MKARGPMGARRRGGWRSLLLVSGVVLALPAAAGSATAELAPQEAQETQETQEEAFPHREHARLFPLCTGCHEGVPRGDSATSYPGAGLCGRCHDGEELDEVTWSRPAPEPGNLRFDHPTHDRESGAEEEAPVCSDCHGEEGAPRMAVERSRPARCFACHEHRTEDHYADAECSTCHVSLAETRFSLSEIESLPRPGGHDADDFLAAGHGEQARATDASCSTCHTRERCTSCHVEGERSEVVAAIPRAPEGMSLPTFEARYPTPASHEAEEWLEQHGPRASVEACSTCHARQDCTSCHSAPGPTVVAELADRSETGAPGAGVGRRAPGSHDSPFFSTEHAALAATSPESCSTCHAQSFCTDCHASEAGSGFHPDNFTTRHASAAYGARMECSNCHDAAVFCRDCHNQIGLGSQARSGGPTFHDGQPLWVLRHGQAARQGLESCASCHRQRDCLRCHSTVGAFQVNPHGAGFDAERFAERNREICFACHLNDPLDGRNP